LNGVGFTKDGGQTFGGYAIYQAAFYV